MDGYIEDFKQTLIDEREKQREFGGASRQTIKVYNRCILLLDEYKKRQEPILKISDGWVINPKSAKDESEDVVYLILVEADSLPLIGTYADNYGYFSTTNEIINIKNVYAIKEFKYPTPPTRDNESGV